MKVLLLCLLMTVPLYADEKSIVIDDGASLMHGLDVYFDVRNGAPEPSHGEALRAVEAATYTQAFLAASYISEGTCPDKAPFRLPPHGVNAEEFAKVVHKYLSDHPERMHEDAHVLVFDALKAAYPSK